jgi:hypothetical protein
MALDWGPFCGREWKPGQERPAGEWIGPTIALVVLLAIAVLVAVA